MSGLPLEWFISWKASNDFSNYIIKILRVFAHLNIEKSLVKSNYGNIFTKISIFDVKKKDISF